MGSAIRILHMLKMSDTRSTLIKNIQIAQVFSRQSYRGNQSHQTLQFRHFSPSTSPSRIHFSSAMTATKKTPNQQQNPHTPAIPSIPKPCPRVTPALPWPVGCTCKAAQQQLQPLCCLAMERPQCFTQPKMQLAAASPIPSTGKGSGHL